MTDKTPMTVFEKKAAALLNNCTFLPASYNKRFARSMSAIANSDTPELTDKQRKNLWRLVWRYRRQIPDRKILGIAKLTVDAMPEPAKPVDPDEQAVYEGWPKFRLTPVKLESIFDARCRCECCGWNGAIGDCEPDVDGDGSLGCPRCMTVVTELTN